jgi:hypothetical protein
MASGREFEDWIAQAADAANVRYHRQVPLSTTSIADGGNRADFILDNLPGFEKGLIVECKSQTSAGTAYQKLLYTCMNIAETYPLPTIIIADGIGIPLRMIDYLRRNLVKPPLVGILTAGQFFSFLRAPTETLRRVNSDE